MVSSVHPAPATARRLRVFSHHTDRLTPKRGAHAITACTCANGLLDKDVTTVQGGSGETCWTDEGHNYNNHTDNIAIVTNGMNTTGECCSACSAHPECKFFTFYEGRCYLKKSDYGRSPLRDAVSGGFGTKPSSWPGSGGGPVPGGGCDQGIREGAGGQPCLWWSQGW